MGCEQQAVVTKRCHMHRFSQHKIRELLIETELLLL